MASCGHSTIFFFLPPTVTFLLENFPKIVPDLTIDRALLRCRLCDLIDSQTAANAPETSPGLESEAAIKQQISELRQAITQRTSKDTDALPRLKKKLRAAAKATDYRILGAWKRYWAIWGPDEGPEGGDEDWEERIEFEYPEEESNIEVEVEEKVQSPTEAASKAAAVDGSLKAAGDRPVQIDKK